MQHRCDHRMRAIYRKANAGSTLCSAPYERLRLAFIGGLSFAAKSVNLSGLPPGIRSNPLEIIEEEGGG
jgi:hypothetical protein